VTATGYTNYSNMFYAIGATNLAAFVGQIGVIRTARITEKYGEYMLVRDTASGP
jgi:hypothetical protein